MKSYKSNLLLLIGALLVLLPEVAWFYIKMSNLALATTVAWVSTLAGIAMMAWAFYLKYQGRHAK